MPKNNRTKNQSQDKSASQASAIVALLEEQIVDAGHAEGELRIALRAAQARREELEELLDKAREVLASSEDES